jgi:hypothetical protein
MSMSISGQNERWAQLNAYQPPPVSPSGQNGGWDSTIGTTPSSGAAGNTASGAGTSGALSDGMSIALMAFGGWGNGSSTASRATGQSSGTSGTSSAGSAPSTPDGSSLASQLLTDVQSLVSALTGTTSAPTGTSAASGNTGTGAVTGLTGTAQQNLQSVASDLDSIASASGSSQPAGVGGPSPGSPPWSNGISNPGSGSAGGWNPGYSDSIQQQFALSAYTANTQSGLDTSATSLLASINV